MLLALCVHKVPEAIGYGLFLEQQRCPASLATRNLLLSPTYTFVNSTPVQIYASVTPLATLAGYGILGLVAGQMSSGTLGMDVGMLLLFAVGTMIYVVTMQILPEVYPQSHIHPGESHDHHVHQSQADSEQINTAINPTMHNTASKHNNNEIGSKLGRVTMLSCLLAGLFSPLFLYFVP